MSSNSLIPEKPQSASLLDEQPVVRQTNDLLAADFQDVAPAPQPQPKQPQQPEATSQLADELEAALNELGIDPSNMSQQSFLQLEEIIATQHQQVRIFKAAK